MEEELGVIGGCLRRIRKERRLTLQQLADRAGMSPSLISKIENLRTAPSLSVLLHLARALDIDLAEILQPSPDAPARKGRRWLHVPSGGLRRLDREENSGYAYHLFFESRLGGDRQQVMLVEVEPGAKRAAVVGDGTEILYLVSGSLLYRIGEDVIDFQAGDVLFFDSSIPHVPENATAEKAIVFAVYHLREPVF